MDSNNHALIHHFLEESANAFPDKTALIHENVRATYEEINLRANHLAHSLLKQGITTGDRVALIQENCLEYVISYYGALKAGAVICPLSSELKPDGLRPLVEELEPKVLIASSRFERVIKAADVESFNLKSLIFVNPKLDWSSSPFPVYSWTEIIQSGASLNPDIQMDETALASIIYTSGSTGTPKGVMLSHRNVVSNTHSICEYLQLTDKDIQMAVLPFFYVMGKSLLNTHVAMGGTIVINNKFAFPATVIKQMADEQVTGFSGVPSTYAYLLHRSPLESYRDKLKSLRYCTQAGGHMSKQIKQNLRKALPGHTKIYIMYGATEASARLTYLDPDRFNDKIESIGKAIPGVTVQVLDQKGKSVPTGELGEIVGVGSNIMMGYWKDEKATTSVLDQHGYHTGDLGYQDEEGFFYVKGRKDNLLKVGGHRLNPVEIEDAIMETDLVIEVAVVGVPDNLLGNKLVAVAAPKNEDTDQNRILSLCSKLLPKYKLPSEVKFIRTLPKNTSGKVDKARCLEIAGS